MSLSLKGRPAEKDAIAVIHAALDAGINFFDTADAYCINNAEMGHNERLLRKAISSHAADCSNVVIATKGIISRPGGAWVAGSDPDELFRACE